MSVLHVFDIGSFVHAGAVNQHAYIEGPILNDADGYRQTYIHTGGVCQLLNAIVDIPIDHSIVFCADRNPTIKKDMISGYKGNRDHKMNIEIEKEVIEIVLEDIGFPVLKEDGYEADDFIYSLVKKHHNKYDSIKVYTGDSDLFFLVDEKVSIEPSKSNGKRVNLSNYSSVVDSKKYVPYNTVTFSKILKGDRSDCIPALPSSMQAKLSPLMLDSDFHSLLGDKEMVMKLVQDLCPAAAYQVDNVFPLLVDTPDDISPSYDRQLLREWGYICKARRYRKVPISEHVNEIVEYMISRQLYDD